MNHRASSRFWIAYSGLPIEVQRLADGAYSMMKRDERHPSLHLKRVGRFWSARVGAHHRVLAIQDGGTLVWFWIGKHDEYDRLIEGS